MDIQALVIIALLLFSLYLCCGLALCAWIAYKVRFNK